MPIAVFTFRIDLEPAYGILYRPDDISFFGERVDEMLDKGSLTGLAATNDGKDRREFVPARCLCPSLPRASLFRHQAGLLWLP